MRTVRTKKERENQYQQLTDLLENNKDFRNDCWKCVKQFYLTYFGKTLDEVVECSGIPSISTVERDWRKLRENNPKLKDKELDQAEYKQVALDSVVVEKGGKARLL